MKKDEIKKIVYYAFILLKFNWISSEEKKTKKIPWKINSKGKVGSSKDYLSKTFKSQCELMT